MKEEEEKSEGKRREGEEKDIGDTSSTFLLL